MSTGLIIAVSVVVGVVGLLVILGLVFRGVRRGLECEIKERLAGSKIIMQHVGANFFGLQSRGRKQTRGNGALVLCSTELYFLRALPRMEIRIPLTEILEVTLPKSFNGKSIFRSLLCVKFRTEGREDAIAWATRNPEEWKRRIDSLR